MRGSGTGCLGFNLPSVAGDPLLFSGLRTGQTASSAACTAPSSHPLSLQPPLPFYSPSCRHVRLLIVDRSLVIPDWSGWPVTAICESRILIELNLALSFVLICNVGIDWHRARGGQDKGGGRWCKRRQAFIAELFIRLSVRGYAALGWREKIMAKIQPTSQALSNC